LLGRIIRVSSNPGEIVLDPFAGSGTTLAVAKKLGRQYLGFELSPNYFAKIQKRLQQTKEGEPLVGAEDSKTSAPPTPAEPTRRRSRRARAKYSSEQSLFQPGR